MKVSLMNMIQGRAKLLSTIGLFTLVGLSAGLQNLSQKNTNILMLQDGLQTCFKRVHNSYTARLLGSGGEYLSPSFVNTTEECFGEAIKTYENLGLSNTTVLDDLNGLVNDVSWFHQKATAQAQEGLFDGNPENVLMSVMGSRYEKLEMKKESVDQALYNSRQIISSQKSTLGLFFYGVAAIVPLLIALDYFRKRSLENALEGAEKEAKDLLSEEKISHERVYSVVLTTLRSLRLNNLARAFEFHFARSSQEGVSKEIEQQEKREDTAGPILMAARDRIQRSYQMDQLWDENNAPEKAEPIVEREKLNLEESITNVLDIVSSKIFTQGIKLDINTEEIKIYGETEPLEQAIYNVLVNAIENYNFDDPHKYLSISTRKLGSTVLLDFFDSGREFSKEFLRQAKGLATGKVENTELAIAKSLIEDFSSKISFENVANENGKHVGRKVQIVLEAVSSDQSKVSSRRLARLEKTTKKDLLKKIKKQKEA